MEKSKEQVKPEPLSTVPGATGIKIKDSTYWKWRLTIEEMQHAQTKVNHATSLQKIETLNAALSQMSATLLGKKLQEIKEQLANAKKDYDAYKVEIEKEIGRSLNNCSIDEFTYEVIELQKEPLTKGT